MFDQLLEKSVTEGTIITVAVGQEGDEPTPDPILAEGLIAARHVFVDPEHVQRMVVKMSGDRTFPWW